MKTFLGLPFFRKQLSDAEIVEKTRREIERWQRYGKWLLFFQTVVIIAWVCLFYVIVKLLADLGGWAGGQGVNLALGGLVIGLVFGLGFGVQFLHALEEWGKSIAALKGDRTSVLLVKYHDTLNEIIRQTEDHENQTNCQEGQGRTGQGGRVIADAIWN